VFSACTSHPGLDALTLMMPSPSRCAAAQEGPRKTVDRALRLALATTIALAAWLAPAGVGAAEWYEHYDLGLAAEARGAWVEALREFAAAAEAMPFPRRRAVTPSREVILDYDPHYHMAICLTELHRPRLAEEQLRVAQRAHVTPREKLAEVWARLKAGGAPGRRGAPPGETAGHIKVDSDPPGARVIVDGVEVGTTPLGPAPFPPGEHVVRVEAPGFGAVEERVPLRPGAAVDLLIPLAPAAGTAVPRSPTAAPTAVQNPTAAPTPIPTAAASPAPTPAAVAPRVTPLGTSAAAAGAATASAVRPITLPTRPRRLLWPILGLSFLVLAAVVGGLLLRGRQPPPAVTAPTVAYEQAATVFGTGAKIGAYELSGILGRGGMATTYRATRAGEGRDVALKVPHEGCLTDETFVARFLREGELGEQLHHPRIVRILEAGEARGRPYLAMELIEGHTLKSVLKEHGPMALRRALEIAHAIAEALDYAHAKGVVHRDLKPENVMLLGDGTLKVMDFGIARLADRPGLTTSNLFLGTPLYAAPEMVDPKHVDHRVDLYALGIILFEMLEGTVPFVADSPYRVLEMHMNEPLPARERLSRPVAEPVWRVVARLCEKEPAARYPSAQALLVELNQLLRRLGELEGGQPE
jgi:predicted Ser/Thr protein kinase